MDEKLQVAVIASVGKTPNVANSVFDETHKLVQRDAKVQLIQPLKERFEKEGIRVFFIRFFYWGTILRSFRGIRFKSVINLVLSTLVDVLTSLVLRVVYLVLLVLSALVDTSSMDVLFPIVLPDATRMLFNDIYRVEGLNVIVYARGGTGDLAHLLPGREGPVEDFIRSALQPGDVFVDVGANVGYYTILRSVKRC